MLPEVCPQELAAALDAVAMQLLRDAEVDQPPVDAVAVAARCGFQVAWDARQSGRARLVRIGTAAGDPQVAILLKPDPRSERLQWAVAHELGEAAAAQVFTRLDIAPAECSPNAREQVANHLASRLLLPSAWFEADAVALGWDLPRLKERFRSASHELIARRMLDFDPPIIVTIFDQNQVTMRRSNLPGRVPPLSAEESTLQRQIHATSLADEWPGPPRLQGWAVHEPSWKREILRCECAEPI
jgi:hypothetical protein